MNQPVQARLCLQPLITTQRSAPIQDLNPSYSALLTGTPNNIIRLCFLQQPLCVSLALDLLQTAHQHRQSALIISAKLLNSRHLLVGAYDAGHGPATAEEQRGEQLGDLAVASEEQDVMRGSHDVDNWGQAVSWVVVCCSRDGEDDLGCGLGLEDELLLADL